MNMRVPDRDVTDEGRMVKLTADVSHLQSDVVKLTADVSHIQSDVVKLTADVGHLQSDMVKLKSDVGHLQSDMTELKGEVKSVRGGLDDLRVQFHSFKTDVAKEFGSVRAAIERTKLWMIATGGGIILSVLGAAVALARFLKP